jgi:hypothetical protein
LAFVSFRNLCASSNCHPCIRGAAVAGDPESSRELTADQTERVRDRLLVWVNEVLVGDFRLQRHLATFHRLQVGNNEAGFSTAEPAFAGSLERETVDENLRAQILRSALDQVDVERPD